MKRFTMAIAAAAFAAALAVSAFAQQGSTAQPATPATPASEPAKAAPAERPARSSSKSMSHAAMHKTDINAASREDLMKLPGITDAVADKIIAARPFKSKAELASKKVLTAKEYAKVRAMVIAHQSAEAGTASK